MKVYIIPNFLKEKTDVCLKNTYDKLISLDNEIIFSENICCGYKATYLSENDAFFACDYVIVIGGDGSIIHEAKKAAQYNKSVLGINCGRLGYLSGIEADEIDKLEAIQEGKYFIENRSMMVAEFESGQKKYKEEFLNDAVVSKGAISRIIDVSVNFQDSSVNYRADGVIVATSTGSTAYSLSAGGPIVSPELDVTIVTPISAHSFQNKSIVLPTNEKLSIKNISPSNTEVYLSIDGEEVYKIDSESVVSFSKSPHQVKLIKIAKKSFFDTLANKIV